MNSFRNIVQNLFLVNTSAPNFTKKKLLSYKFTWLSGFFFYALRNLLDFYYGICYHCCLIHDDKTSMAFRGKDWESESYKSVPHNFDFCKKICWHQMLIYVFLFIYYYFIYLFIIHRGFVIYLQLSSKLTATFLYTLPVSWKIKPVILVTSCFPTIRGSILNQLFSPWPSVELMRMLTHYSCVK